METAGRMSIVSDGQGVHGRGGAVRRGLAVMFFVLMIAGCSRGVRIGSWQVIDAQEPLHATRVEVLRGVAVVGAKDSAPRSSRLAVDLVSGRATYVAYGKEAYPIAIDPDVLAMLRTSIADRSWQVKEIAPPKGLASALVYEMTVFVGEEEVAHVARWHVPAKGKVPAFLGQVTLVFNDAARAVDPLSNRFNLLD